MHKGNVYKDVFFESEEQARNYLKFQFPRGKWQEIEKNVLINTWRGTKFTIKSIDPYDIDISVKHR